MCAHAHVCACLCAHACVHTRALRGLDTAWQDRRGSDLGSFAHSRLLAALFTLPELEVPSLCGTLVGQSPPSCHCLFPPSSPPALGRVLLPCQRAVAAGPSSSQSIFTFAIQAGGPKWQSLTDIRRAMCVATELLRVGRGRGRGGISQTTRNKVSLSQCLQSTGLQSHGDEQVTVHRRRGRH